MRVTIDRFEGDFAIVELDDMTMIDMPIQLVPDGAREGDVLDITIDKTETADRQKRINNLMDKLWD